MSLRMTIWSANEDHLALFDGIAAEYIAANDGVSGITFDPLSFETYTTALTTQIAGGNAPDLAWIFESSFQLRRDWVVKLRGQRSCAATETISPGY